ncbi:ABA4-like family protein [Pelagibacteraceae bacterium]|nr:ABA4-like family protein [Pelagibacteraceae bacterium]
MINNIGVYLTYENIYLVSNWGVLPFWLMLMVIPNHGFTKFFVHSIVAPFLLAAAYIFLAYKIYLNENIFGGLNLYLGLDNLYAVFSDEAFLLIFWLHFLSISLFVGSWIARDSCKYLIPKILTILSLILSYFSGPVGLVFYWLVRIFYAKKIGFND